VKEPVVVLALILLAGSAAARAQSGDGGPPAATSPPPLAADEVPPAPAAPSPPDASPPADAAAAVPAPAKPAPPPAPVVPPAPAAPSTPAAGALNETVRSNAAPAPPAAGEPSADRIVLGPTAYTHPAGSFFVSSYDIVVLQAGYALSDHTQVSVTVTPPIGEPGEVRLSFLDVTLKSAVVRDGLVRAAALGSVSGGASSEPALLLVGRVGGVVQLCLRLSCESSFSINSNVLLLGPVLLMANGAGAIVRATRRLSFVAEVDTVVPLGREGGNANAVLAGGGVRLHFTRFAADLSVLRGVGPSRELVLPVLGLTYRSAPAAR
jgi:hypothetical protein